MSILNGWLKTRKYKKTADGYIKQSLDTSSETVYMNDGNTAETNLGAIQGLTSDIASNSNSIAASTSITHNLQGQIGTINNNLSNLNNRFIGNWQEWGALQVTSKDRTILRRVQIDADGVLKYVYSNNAGSTWTVNDVLTENTIEKTHITFTPNLNYVITDYSWCYKSGNTVIFNFDLNYNVPTNYTDYVLGTISSCYPDRTVFTNADTSLGEKIQMWLNPNGELVVNVGNSSVGILTNIRCQIMWFV